MLLLMLDMTIRHSSYKIPKDFVVPSDSLEQRRFGRRTKCIIIAAVDAVAKRGSVGEGG